ncbi:MAG: hypothetical protein LBF81_01785 [Prevotellaceae bacterium]|nr:hypothetical protein [Prevotellaceae bacterium]
MGYYSDYINQRFTFDQLSNERKIQLKRIAELRKREVLVYASDATKPNSSIYPPDLIPFADQLSFIKTNNIDVIIETPGGIAEVVEDMVKLLHLKHERVGIIIPGSAKSAGTIFTMAGDEILMGTTSALGPIDAQIISSNGKRFSADAFLDGLNKIKKEIEMTGRLNPAYIPMLQNISPGEIQHCENAQNFAKTLVTTWLKTYKFKYWDKHSKSGKPVTDDEKKCRAEEIASALCKHSDWLTHGRSIRISDLENLGLQIIDYTKNNGLGEAIERYYTLLRMTFDMTGIYKIFETCDSQIYQSISQATPPAITMPYSRSTNKPTKVLANFSCPKCSTQHTIQLDLAKNIALEKNAIGYPAQDIFTCPHCAATTNLTPLRLQVEAQTGKKVITS